MNHSDEALFEAFRAKCQREGWYGPELLSPINREVVSPDDPNRFGFIYPPATDEQLQETAILLGFPLPSFLRALYTAVANGGFGPGTGLRGICGGYAGGYSNHDGKVVFQYQWRSPDGTFDYSLYQEQGKQREMQVPYGKWLDRLLPICDLGCCMEACIDDQERMFLVAPLENDDFYALEQMPWTFEEWLWRWVKGEDIYRW